MNRRARRTVTSTGLAALTALTISAAQAPSIPQVAVTSPLDGAALSDIVTVIADASDETGIAAVQFQVDGTDVGPEDTDPPYGLTWDTRTVADGTHLLTARARNLGGNSYTSAPVSVYVANTSFFQNEILATGFDLPTSIEFLPDGRMLVTELEGTIKVLSPPYTQAAATPFLTLTNVGSAGVQQGIYDIALDPTLRAIISTMCSTRLVHPTTIVYRDSRPTRL